MSIRIVIDVDDTISTNIRRLPYEFCEPRFDVIEKINHLHDDLGYTIVLHTARGMVSCEGDIDRIIKKNKAVLEAWLEKYNVHYDELIFGKPLGDMYVDDKALDVQDFIKAPFYELRGGGSGRGLHRIAHIVKKDLGTPEETERFKDWVEECGKACLYPRVISYLYSEVYMEYVDGVNLCDDFTRKDMYTLISTIEGFGNKKVNWFDMTPHLDNLEKNRSEDKEFNEIIDVCRDLLLEHEKEFRENASFCHGDLILSNVLKNAKGLWLIDPRYFKEGSTYLFDYGKLRMSLMDYEKIFGISEQANSGFLAEYDEMLKYRGIYTLVLIASLLFICRLYRYKTDANKEKVVQMAKHVLGEINNARE